MAGKSTLNRLELSRLEPTRYHKISHNPNCLKRLRVDVFLEAHARAPNEIILDLDATDDPVHGEQEGRFFHGYYDCYLPLYVFCGRHLLAAKLRPASMDAAAGAVEEVFVFCWRADSGFARDEFDGVVRGERRALPVRIGEERPAHDEIAGELAQAEGRAGGPASRHAPSRTSCGRRAAAGAGGGGWSARPSSPRTKPIPASSSPR